MEYLLAWRMAVAKDLLRRHDFRLGQVAERVGYGSASSFSTAFNRYVGQLPSRYARERWAAVWDQSPTRHIKKGCARCTEVNPRGSTQQESSS
jgi:AraC-like DNA-binding protein